MAGFDLNYFRDLSLPALNIQPFQPRLDFSKLPSLMDQIQQLSQVQQNTAQAAHAQALVSEQRRQAAEAENLRKLDAAAYGQPAFGGQPMFQVDRTGGQAMGGATGGTGSTGQAAGRPSSGPEEIHPDDLPWHNMIQQARNAIPIYAGQEGGHTVVVGLQKQIGEWQAKMDENRRNRATVAETAAGHRITEQGNMMTNARETFKNVPTAVLRDQSFQERMGAANPMWQFSPEQWNQMADDRDRLTTTQLPNGGIAVQTGRGQLAVAAPNQADAAMQRVIYERNTPPATNPTVHAETPVVTIDPATKKEYPGRRILYSNGTEEMRYDGETPPMGVQVQTKAVPKPLTEAQVEQQKKQGDALYNKFYGEDANKKTASVVSTIDNLLNTDRRAAEAAKAGHPIGQAGQDDAAIISYIQQLTPGNQAIRTTFYNVLERASAIDDRVGMWLNSGGDPTKWSSSMILPPKFREELKGLAYAGGLDRLANGIYTERYQTSDLKKRHGTVAPVLGRFEAQAQRLLSDPVNKRFLMKYAPTEVKKLEGALRSGSYGLEKPTDTATGTADLGEFNF